MVNWDLGRHCKVLSDSRAVEQEKMAHLDEVQLQLKDGGMGDDGGCCALPGGRWCLDVFGLYGLADVKNWDRSKSKP